MNLLQVALVVGAVLGLTSAYPQQGQGQCEEGATYQRDCNTCTCRNGLEMCTLMACLPLDWQSRQVRQAQSQCEEGTTYNRDCNTCMCRNGREICTLMACLPEEQRLPDGATCKPGSRWMQDCNWCSCSETGIPMCTLMACVPGYEPKPGEPICLGSSSWMTDECNWCSCRNGVPGCTKRLCPRQTQRVQIRCEEGTTYNRDCNTCMCRNGREICTQMACLPARQTQRVQIRCAEGTTYNRDCNTCMCRNGREICTQMACLPEEQRLPDGATCKPGSRWMKDCNWCSCTKTGIPICTLMACVPGYEPKPGEPTCLGNSSWMMDGCNWCSCRNGVPGCTKRLCPRQTQRVQIQCEEGATYNKDCNTCMCHNGQEICTLMACLPEEQKLPDDAKCVPGSQWMMDCNWCSCTDTGMAICTLIACEPDYEPQLGEPACLGNSSWKTDDCNWCSCRNGVPACTKRLCPEQNPLANLPADAVCVPGSRWMDDCNWCNCAGNGASLCTLKGCLPGYNPEPGTPTCEGSSMWKVDDCNWCKCINGSSLCTKRQCPIERREEPECQGDPETSRWRSDCNWCRCLNGKPSCTRKLCRPGELADASECEGTASWKDDCNTCNCVNGRPVCTSKHCGQRISVRRRLDQHHEVTCTNGSRWRDSCNWCTCMNGHGGCTLIGCPSDFQTDEPECEPGSHWKKDCNWCSCNDGMAACTKMACVTLYGPEQVCTEGESWREDCNICRCSEGLTICTKKACVGQDTERRLCEEGNMVEGCTAHEFPPHCKLPPVSDGPVCGALMMKWTFDITNANCIEIVYGGCRGTENLYESEAECKASCFPATIPATRRAVKAGSEEPCLKKQDTGPCFGYFLRYSYNAESGQCEEFVYGGCQGNDNNFVSAEKCMEVCRGVTPVEESSCDRSKCPWQRWGHYLAKNCLPQYEGSSCCPTTFICPSADDAPQDPEKCYYKGNVYEIGSNVPVEDPCSAGCFCSQSRVPGTPAEIVCANVECPNLFRPREPGCRPLYRPGECCSYDSDCVDPENPPELEASSLTCVWNNRTYLEGDKMFFDDYPCQECICGPGFSDPNGPGCTKISCGLDFRYSSKYFQGCTPEYFEDKCCPISWLCPGDSRILSPVEEPQSSNRNVQEVGIANVCTLPKDSGPCAADIYRIYYDVEASECRQFSYGGCEGNSNNFIEFEECHQLCSKTPKPSESAAKSAECHLGDLTVALGSTLNTTDCKIDCKCTTPPEVTCVQYRSCEKVTEIRAAQVCPEPACESGCQTIMDTATGCRTCSCNDQSFSCPQQTCPSNCEVDLDFQTGCLSCKCDCSYDALGLPPCPMDCAVNIVLDEVTGCQKCECIPDSPYNPLARQETVKRKCFPENDTGPVPCPQDCVVRRVVDEETGCERCECDPNISVNPLVPHCPKDHTGRPPCPMDCAVHYVVDSQTGCERCECDPNISVNPLVPHCPRDHRGRPPCPMDCAVHYVVDSQTGCERCECDPNNPATPFGPYRPLS